MKKTITAALLGAVLSFPVAHAQMAKQKGITAEELGKHLNELLQKGDDDSKAELAKEAEVMAKSKDEAIVAMASQVYEFTDQQEKAEAVDKSILKRFPKGSRARAEAYGKIFRDEDLSTAEVEQQYQKWLKQFPEKSAAEKDRGIYGQAASSLALRYAKENNMDKVNSYLALIHTPSTHIMAVSGVAKELLKQGQHTAALPLLETAYANMQKAKDSEDTADKTMVRYGYAIPGLLGEAYLADGQDDKGVELLEEVYAEQSKPEAAVKLAAGYVKQGKELDAFLVLQESLIKQGRKEELIAAITPLYTKLNNNKGDLEGYLSEIDKQAKEALVAKYKGEMIKQEAPAFSLVDRDGNTVSLADMKGKVVVLDFWATWCGPCKISFPGMQAAVDKYKDDDEVAFLFIDTWQREDNYKELVDAFIKEHNYTFHVLFDEMKDSAKSTVSAYGVKGIPTKVVIDKEGFIRFQTSGGSDDVQKIVNELETKIELARKG